VEGDEKAVGAIGEPCGVRYATVRAPFFHIGIMGEVKEWIALTD